MKHALTAIADPVYDLPTADVSAVGTLSLLNHVKRTVALNENVTFFVPIIIWHNNSPYLWALRRTDTAKAVEGQHLYGTGKPVVGCERPVQCPPFSSLTEMLGNQKPNVKVSEMANQITAYLPEECFTFNQNVDKSKLYDPTYLLLNRALSSLALLQDNGQDVNEGFTVSHGTVVESLAGIQANLNQAIDLLELANGVTRL